MDWHERIVSDPDTLFGRPRIKGARIGVEFILRHDFRLHRFAPGRPNA